MGKGTSVKERTGLIGELWEKERASKTARQDTDRLLKKSAETRAGQSRSAAAERMAASVRMSQMHAKNLQESQAETRAAKDRAVAAINPWRQAGVDALGKIQEKIATGPGDFEGDPGYQFRMDEGQKALERSASARGGVLSGRAGKEATRYGQDYASGEYDKFIDRYYKSFEPLERMSGSGMTAATKIGGYETDTARSLADQGFRSTVEGAGATKYGGESKAGGIERASDIIAQEEKERAERQYGYAAWKGGEDF